MDLPWKNIAKTSFRLLRWSLFFVAALGYIIYYHQVMRPSEDPAFKEDGEYPSSSDSVSIYGPSDPMDAWSPKTPGSSAGSIVAKHNNKLGLTPYYVRAATSLVKIDDQSTWGAVVHLKEDPDHYIGANGTNSSVASAVIEIDCDSDYLMTDASMNALNEYNGYTKDYRNVEDVAEGDDECPSSAGTILDREANCYDALPESELNPLLIDSTATGAAKYAGLPDFFCNNVPKLGAASGAEALFFAATLAEYKEMDNPTDENRAKIVKRAFHLVQRKKVDGLNLYKTKEDAEAFIKVVEDCVSDNKKNVLDNECLEQNYANNNNLINCLGAATKGVGDPETGWIAYQKMLTDSDIDEDVAAKTKGVYTGPGAGSLDGIKAVANSTYYTAHGVHKATQQQKDACNTSQDHFMLVNVFMYIGFIALCLGLISILVAHAQAYRETGMISFSTWSDSLSGTNLNAAKLSYALNYVGYGTIILSGYFLTASSFTDSNNVYFTQMIYGSEDPAEANHMPVVREDIHGTANYDDSAHYPDNPRTNDILLSSAITLLFLDALLMIIRILLHGLGVKSEAFEGGSMSTLMKTIL